VGRPEVSFIYLATLLVSLAGLAALDRKHKLAFAKNPKAATIAIALPYILFVIWDAAGIALGVFFKGQSAFLTGIMVGPEFPIEELFFLALLCYSTLIVSTWFSRSKR
jgi:lycopene cyclase domain-containing protein